MATNKDAMMQVLCAASSMCSSNTCCLLFSLLTTLRIYGYYTELRIVVLSNVTIFVHWTT